MRILLQFTYNSIATTHMPRKIYIHWPNYQIQPCEIPQSVYELCQLYYYQSNKDDLKGRFPQKSHEIVVGNYFNHVILSKERYPNLKVEANQVTFKGKKYRVESSTSSHNDQGNYLGDDN